MSVDDRASWVFQALIGHKIRIETKAGKQYEGVFKSFDGEKDPLLCIAVATLTVDPSNDEHRVTKPSSELALPWSEVVSFSASNVGIAEEHLSAPLRRSNRFATDADIGRGRGGRADRELQRWEPSAEDVAAMGDLGGGLEDVAPGPRQRGPGGSSSAWDQFALNEAKFGVRTDYAEELYTTALDPTRSKVSAAEADRIAREIERGVPGRADLAANRHMMEERGLVPATGDGLDEEDLYGAVIREESSASGPGARPASSGSAAARGPASAPIDIQARRETNKLRAQLVEGVSRKTSPYGTPKSPLTSPLVDDMSKLEALDLNPGSVTVDEETRRTFAEFKKSQAGAAKKVDVHEFKVFSQTIDNRLRSGSLGSSANGERVGSATSSQRGFTPTSASSARATPEPATDAGDLSGGAASQVAVQSGNGGGAEPPKPKPSLNPFAKSFSFNPAAKEFMPSTGRGDPAGTAPSRAPGTPVIGRTGSSTASTPTSSSGAGSFGASNGSGGPRRSGGGRGPPGSRGGRGGPRYEPGGFVGGPYPRVGQFVPGPPGPPYAMAGPMPIPMVDGQPQGGPMLLFGGPMPMRGPMPPPGMVMMPYGAPPMGMVTGPGRPYPAPPPFGARTQSGSGRGRGDPGAPAAGSPRLGPAPQTSG